MFFTSALPASYLEDLKNLLFFNEIQYRVREDIIAAVEKFGTPSIDQRSGMLWITLGSDFEPKALYVLDKKVNGSLIGVFIYVRDSPDNITLIYLAVDVEYSSHGKYADKMLPVKIFEKMREIASVIKGVDTLTVFLNSRTYKLKLKRENL